MLRDNTNIGRILIEKTARRSRGLFDAVLTPDFRPFLSPASHNLLPKTKKAEKNSLSAALLRDVGPRLSWLLNDERLLFRSLSKDNLGIGLLSHVKMRSIMGDEALNFRVRNGIGCTRFSMDTKEISKNI